MKKIIAASLLSLAVSCGTAFADGHVKLKFAPGEDSRFSWDSYNEWAKSAPDLKGQTVTVTGPWLQPEDGVFRSAIAYFAAATGADPNPISAHGSSVSTVGATDAAAAGGGIIPP